MKRKFHSLIIALCTVGQAIAQIPTIESFENPAHEYKPSTWMHAMSGNMTKEGLTKDLESIKSVGIGGILLFNVSQRIPKGDIIYASDQHVEMLAHAAAECERLGLSFGFHNCDGWSSSGGPWITPEQSMKRLVYKQIVTNGSKVDIQLPQPLMRQNYYDDIAVLAYPATKYDIADMKATVAAINYSNSNIDESVTTQYNNASIAKVESGDKVSAITFDYGTANALRSVSTMVQNGVNQATLYASDNGKDFTLVTELKKFRVSKMDAIFMANFEPVDKRFYRVEYNSAASIKEIQFSHDTFFSDYLSKSSMSRVEDESIKSVAADAKFSTINSNQIIDLTEHIDSNGRLKTKLPKGDWTIMRIGCTTTEAYNHPASDEGRGLECDKYSAKAVETHFNAFAKRVIESAQEVAPNALQYVEIDSFEMGGQNWTEEMPEEFKSRKGYDLLPYLPLLLGKCVNSNEESDAMLSDFRNLCGDLMTENYFNKFGELCHQNGLKYYLEPYGNGPINSLDVTKNCDIPMGEFWMDDDYVIGKGGISGAHIYGKKVISAESFTSGGTINWMGHPAMAKAAGDMAWNNGINEFMFHRFVHQANTHVMPGMTMGFWGFHFDRTQTWWENAGKDWFKYMARGSYLLRQGVPVSDLMIFLGDSSPATFGGHVKGYGDFKYDYSNSDVLINRTTVVNKELVLPEGTRYKILALRNTQKMEMPTLRRLAEIVEAGVPVVGELPTALIGMQNLTESKSEMQELVAKIKSAPNYYPTADFTQIGSQLGIAPDFEITNREEPIDFFHRQILEAGGADIYFVSNPDDQQRTFDCNFRVTGKLHELWFAMSGKSKKVNQWSMSETQTSLSITLEPNESVFVVFKDDTDKRSLNIEVQTEVIATNEISDKWSVEFQKFYGYDQTLQFDQLTDWSLSDNTEVKYYSGTAIYRKTINVDKATLDNSTEVILDLGDVQIAAEIIINGVSVCIDWIAPFENDIYDYLKAGENDIEIHVTNQWTNRLIGDERYPVQNGGFEHDNSQQPQKDMPRWFVENEPMPEGPRITFCTWPFYNKDSQLIPAGLVGPVKMEYLKKY